MDAGGTGEVKKTRDNTADDLPQGRGIKMQNGTTGFGARFATREEMLRDTYFGTLKGKEWQKGGVVIASDDSSIYVDGSESHVITVGATGRGKSTSVAIPSLISMIGAGESAVVIDPVGEIYQQTAGMAEAEGYKVYAINLRDPQRSNCYNPLEVPAAEMRAGNEDFAVELISDFSDTIFSEKSTDDPFWNNSAADYTRGMTIELMDCARPEEVHMRSVVAMNAQGWRSGMGPDPLRQLFRGKEKEYSYFSISGTLNAPNDTRKSIISVFDQHMRVYVASKGLSALLSASDFDITEFGRSKCLLYVIMADEKPALHQLVAALINQWCQLLIREGGKYERNRLPVRVNLLLDEFANITVPNMSNLITVARKRNVRIFMMVQNIDQLYFTFGKERARTIINNCGIRIYLNVSDECTRQELSEECGKVTSVDSRGFLREEPLVPTYKFNQLYRGEALMFREGVAFPFVTNLTPSFRMKLDCPPAPPMPEMKRTQMPVFDIAKFVEEHTERRGPVRIELDD